MKYLKTLIINIGILISILVVVWFSVLIDELLGFESYKSSFSIVIGLGFIVFGLIFRFWASFVFYKNNIKVLRLSAQQKFITEGIYKYTRNPLYIGIVSIMLGFAIFFGSYAALIVAALGFLIFDFWLKYFEEKNLEQKFDKKYKGYKSTTSRWTNFRNWKFFGSLFVVSIAASIFSMYLFTCPEEQTSVNVRHHSVEIQDLTVHYMAAGDPSMPPLLYVRGWPMGLIKRCDTPVEPTIAELGKYFHVFAPRHPGLGKSDLPNKVWNLTDYAAYLHDFAILQNIENPTLMGKSFGGAIAATYAQMYQNEVDILILVNSATDESVRNHAKGILVPTASLLTRILESELAPLAFKRFIINGFLDTPKDEITNSSAEKYLVMVKIFLDYSLDIDFKDLRTPLILVWGNKDKLTPIEKAKKIKADVPNALLLEFDGDHLYMEKNPKIVVDEIMKHLELL